MKTTHAVMTALLCVAAPAFGHGYATGDLTIAHPYALPTPPGATTGGAYLNDLGNAGPAGDALVGVSSAAADAVQLHEMRMDGDVMRMRAVPSIAIAAGQHVAMAPGGGYHLMFVGIHKPWRAGDKLPLTLRFEHAGTVEVIVNVQERGAAAMEHEKMPTK